MNATLQPFLISTTTSLRISCGICQIAVSHANGTDRDSGTFVSVMDPKNRHVREPSVSKASVYDHNLRKGRSSRFETRLYSCYRGTSRSQSPKELESRRTGREHYKDQNVALSQCCNVIGTKLEHSLGLLGCYVSG